MKEPFWGVATRIAFALGKIGGEHARNGLLKGLKNKKPPSQIHEMLVKSGIQRFHQHFVDLRYVALLNRPKTCEEVQGSFWKPHKSKDHDFLHRNYTTFFHHFFGTFFSKQCFEISNKYFLWKSQNRFEMVLSFVATNFGPQVLKNND